MSDIYLWETFDRLGREALERNDFQQANEAFRSAVATAEELEAHDRLVLSLRNLAGTIRAQGQINDSFELLVRTLEVAEQHLDDQHSQIIEAHRDIASVCQELGYLDKADGHLKLVLAFEGLNASPLEQCETLLELAKLAMSRDLPHQAAHYYDRVVDIKTRELGEGHPEIAQALIWLSTAQFQSGQGPQATPSVDRAMKILESQFADEPVHLAQSLLAAAQLVEDSGQLESSLSYRKRALDLLAEHVEDGDPRIWDTREQIATSLAGLGKLEEAVELLEYCLRNREELEDFRRGGIFKNLGGLYLSLGRIEKADEHYVQASELLAGSLGKDHPVYLATQEERIQYLYFTGRIDEALELALGMIRATEERYGPGHPHTAQSYSSTALLAFKAERWEVSLELMKASEKIWLNLRPVPHDVLANCRTNIASCLLHLGQPDEAELSLLSAEEFAGPALLRTIETLRQEIAKQKNADEVPQDLPESPEELVTDEESDTLDLSNLEPPETTDSSQDPFEEIDQAPSPPDSEVEAEVEVEIAPEVEASEEDSEYALPDVVADFATSQPETQSEEPVSDVEEPSPGEEGSSEPQEFVERRRSPRASLVLNKFFDLKVTSDEESDPIQVRSFFVDLGTGGFRVNSERPLDPSSKLQINLPAELLGEEVELQAQVVWQKPLFGESYLQGLQFAGLTENQEQLIHQRFEGENSAGSTRNSRQHFRLYRPFPIKVRSPGNDSWVSSYATDLSLDGLGTRLTSSLSAEEEIKVRLELDFELPTVEVEARVAWSKEGDNGVTHGLQFASMGPVEAKTIKRYIDRCLEFSPD